MGGWSLKGKSLKKFLLERFTDMWWEEKGSVKYLSKRSTNSGEGIGLRKLLLRTFYYITKTFF